jgi:hypothetical protein
MSKISYGTRKSTILLVANSLWKKNAMSMTGHRSMQMFWLNVSKFRHGSVKLVELKGLEF